MAQLLNIIQLGTPQAAEIVKKTLAVIAHETRVKAGQKGSQTRRTNAEAKQKLQSLVTRFAPQQSGAAKSAMKAAKKAAAEKNKQQNGWFSLNG